MMNFNKTMNRRNVSKRENMNYVNKTFHIPYRNWNIYIDGPCNLGLQLDNSFIDYLKFLYNDDDLYILGVRYYDSKKSKSWRKTLTLYDIQLGITETCTPDEKDNMKECALRGIREELQCEMKIEPHEILPPTITTTKNGKEKKIHNFVFHVTSHKNIQLIKESIIPPSQSNKLTKTCSVIIGHYQYLLPIIDNFNLNKNSAVADTIIYPVLYPLKRLTHYKNLFIPVNKRGNFNAFKHVDLFKGRDEYFEYPEEIIIPYHAPDFYQLVRFALINKGFGDIIASQNINVFKERVNMFMKYIELERLKSRNIQIKQKQRMNTFDNLLLLAKILSAKQNPFEENPFEENNRTQSKTTNPFNDPFINIPHSSNNNNPFQNVSINRQSFSK